ncbi:uncharacterized protein GIQ15_01303 [Arthroderma uncinatum]|uniref:uncharacterized protein n=1 Tax=Arthroderma uncinatum TaxID=74035 RepID=UPI00144A589F|nr:uncharacterized protein GIQ15_01303 [Arthroderma uncinatum]KAF3491786.1 hypothetical protein GIQ15_01303 [Arthroderma uncinatum]
MLMFAVGSTSLLVYVIYDFVTRVNPKYTRFPNEVAIPLRKAVYYTELDLNPPSALAYYKQALQAAHQVGLHPYSDEVLGIRLQVALMLERASLTKGSIEVLEKTRNDCEGWVEKGRRRQLILDRERQNEKQILPDPSNPDAIAEHEAAMQKEQEEEILRNQVMKKVAGINVKLAELYSSEHPQDGEKVEKLLVSAVNISRAELQRRRDLKLPVYTDEADAYTTLADVGNTCNELADHYAGKGKNDLATILYMQALSLFKEDEGSEQNKCIQVVLLNNISSQMAEHAQKVPLGAPLSSSSSINPVSREQLLSAAAEWAKKALDVASHIEASARDEQCDQACLTALYNLGEISEMQENTSQAVEFYQKARASAVGLQFTEGIERADEALKRLQNRK